MEMISSRLLLGIASVVLVALTYKSGVVSGVAMGMLSNINIEQKQQPQQSSLRRLSIDEYSDPKTTEAVRSAQDNNKDDPSIRF